MTGEQDDGAPKGCLSGILIADFSRVLAGPLATMLLGDLGATVVKVEHPSGDDTRSWGPPFVGDESTYYLSVNRNKRSVVIDLSTPEGQRDALVLANRASVLVENFRPGRLTDFGLGYEALKKTNPGLVYCSISGFGGDVPLVGYDFVVQAMSGLMDITGPEEGPPSKTGVAIVDVLTGLYAAIGILAALQGRCSTGSGQLVEVNLMSSALASLVNQASSYLNTGRVPKAMGNRHPSITPYETIRARDGYIAIAVGNDRQFRSLCDAIGLQGAVDDGRFSDNASRVKFRHELILMLETTLGTRDVTEWVSVLRPTGVACGPVNDIARGFSDAESLGLEPTVEMQMSQNLVRMVADPISLSELPATYRFAPPELGRDSSEVLEWLRTDTSKDLKNDRN